jgi:hypothetical protein
MRAAVKTTIVLLAQKDPAKEVELSPEEGPVESCLAVAQDMWGGGNLSPCDTPFAARAIGAMAPSKSASIGVVCHHLGRRMLSFGRESGIWIDAFEGESALSRLEKRPKDKVKLLDYASGQFGNARFTHMAMLSPSRLDGPHEKLVQQAAKALKPGGSLFLADLMQSDGTAAPAGLPPLNTQSQYRGWLEQAGLKFYSEHALTGDISVALLRGLHSAINMLANVKNLQEPWKSQRLAAFRQELDFAVTLHKAIDRDEITAFGLLYTKGE